MYANATATATATATENDPLVAIFLCTYNGARFLAEQLDSISYQTHRNWVVIASDDGSTDQTLEILQKYQANWPAGKLTIRNGPQKGFCRNFQYLTSDESISADFFAFCDQDDVWLPEKLTRAIDVLRGISTNIPAVYGARTVLIDEENALLGYSPIFPLTPSFKNALVQSIAGGNTMVFNGAAKKVISIDSRYEIVSHDWWAYLVVTGMGGKFIYDPVPTTLYRQHKANIIGEKKGFLRNFSRFNSLLSGNLQKWIEGRNVALDSIANLLTPENQFTFKQFCQLRRAPFIVRLWGLKKLGIHRQCTSENMAFYLAVSFGKI
ncbi:glycosyl transferase family 2 [Polynucleobacter cosmopolitanus]|uniref:Glycosyl transferase family 2 n=1 Tax=Polynucleobacter cosmopolitanus TaxID=351345 RepID=A0A229FXC7_9BURK|nr:glycosyl transferase family 2 [Polynucleobacter cosmopolitanus]